MPIVIEVDVLIGSDAIILKGIRTDEGAIVASGAVITKSITSYTIWGGNPARKIGNRFSRDELIKHLSLIGTKHKIGDLDQNFIQNAAV